MTAVPVFGSTAVCLGSAMRWVSVTGWPATTANGAGVPTGFPVIVTPRVVAVTWIGSDVVAVTPPRLSVTVSDTRYVPTLCGVKKYVS